MTSVARRSIDAQRTTHARRHRVWAWLAGQGAQLGFVTVLLGSCGDGGEQVVEWAPGSFGACLANSEVLARSDDGAPSFDDIPRRYRGGFLPGDAAPTLIVGGENRISYSVPDGSKTGRWVAATLDFAALAHDLAGPTRGFLAGRTKLGLSVVVEYRITGEAFEQRRLIESACFGMLTGLIYDDHAQRLLLWDSQRERLFEFSLERYELRLLTDVAAIPALAGYRSLWWLNGSELWITPEWISDHHTDPAGHIVLHDLRAHDGRLNSYQVFDSSGTPRTDLLAAPPPSDTTVHRLPAPKPW